MTTYLYDCFCFCKSFLLCISLCLSHFLAWRVWAGGHGGPRRGNAGARRGDIWWVPAGNQPTIRKVYTWLCSVIKVSQESAFELDYNYIADHFCVKPFKKNCGVVDIRQRWVHSLTVDWGSSVFTSSAWIHILAVLDFNGTPLLPSTCVPHKHYSSRWGNFFLSVEMITEDLTSQLPRS